MVVYFQGSGSVSAHSRIHSLRRVFNHGALALLHLNRETQVRVHANPWLQRRSLEAIAVLPRRAPVTVFVHYRAGGSSALVAAQLERVVQ